MSEPPSQRTAKLPPWRERFPGRTWFQAMFYDRSRAMVNLTYTLAFRLKVEGREHIPRTGGVLALANHQSHLDPPLMGAVAGNRGMAAVARDTLMSNPVFKWWIVTYHAIPIRRGAGDTSAIRNILEVLRSGEYVAMFPEGTRTHDGHMQPLERGITLLLRKADCLVVPVGIEGTGLAWPRGKPLPRVWARPLVHVCVGRGIPSSELLAMKPDEALLRIATEIDQLRLKARARLRERTRGRYPPPGIADTPSPCLTGKTDKLTESAAPCSSRDASADPARSAP